MQGICHLSCIPVRVEDSSKTEMVTQLLFGETYRVIERQGVWIHIIANFDDYQGWIHETQFCEFDGEPTGQMALLQSVRGELVNGNEKIYLPLGAQLYLDDNGHVQHRGVSWNLEGTMRKVENLKPNRDLMTSDSLQWLNAPYLWGGRTVWGVDCSGFTQVVYKLAGIQLHRDAYQQATQGETLSFLDETQPGDLAFFDNEEGKIIHVGILLDSRRIIHAGGSVRVDKIDQQGIFNVDTGRYTHKLRLIKKVI